MSYKLIDIPVRWRSSVTEPNPVFVPPQHRLSILLDLIRDGKPGDIVYAHPKYVDFWMALPDYVALQTFPDGVEIKRRLQPDAWAYKITGVPSQYRNKPPSDRSKFYLAWRKAEQGMRLLLDAHGHRARQFQKAEQSATASAVADIPLDRLLAAPVLALDTETDTKAKKRPRPMVDPIIGISIADQDGEWWIPTEEIPRIREELNEALRDKTVIGHHAKFDALTTRRLGLDVRFTDDTMLMAYMFGGKYPLGLKPLTRQLLDRPAQDLGPLIERYGSSGQVPKTTLIPYAKADARNTWDVWNELKVKGPDPLYGEIEWPISKLLTEMEWRGWRVDNDRLAQVELALERMLEAQLEKLSKYGIDKPLSNKQVWEFIRGEGFDLPKTKTGYKVDRKTLLGTSHPAALGGHLLGEPDMWYIAEGGVNHPAIIDLLLYKEAHKRKSNWVQAMRFQQTPDGYAHPSFRQVPISGRLSVTGLQVQNFTYELRACLVPDPGQVLLAADMSQFEMRIMARAAMDEVLIEEFRSGVDIHEANRIALGFLTRKDSKTAMYGIGYGMDAVKLSERTGRSVAECREYINSIFGKYRQLRRWMNALLKMVRGTQYSYTMAGRARWLPDIISADSGYRGHAERAAINHVIQGTAADMMKIGMLILEPLLQAHGARQLAQVHDEWVISTPDPFKTYDALMVVQAEFQEWLDPVPVTMEILVGPNWGMKGKRGGINDLLSEDDD